MYFNDYDEYMRSMLGYNRNNANSYNDVYSNPYDYNCTYNCYNRMDDTSQAMEELYPEVYKKINPIVCRMCQNNTMPVTNDLIEQMTEQIYSSINADDINIVNINVETREAGSPKQVVAKQVESREVRDTLKYEIKENRSSQESRSPRPNNQLLRDLIRILLLNQLIRKPNPRPPFPRPGMGPRPPFPGPGPRPAPWNRDYQDGEYYNY